MVKTGVLLVNTGTPSEPTVGGVRDFLAEMLSDPMLVSVPRPLWNIVLNRFILPRRPQRTVTSYQEVWTAQGAPFLLTSLRQRDLLSAELERRVAARSETRSDREAARPGAWKVELAMRYGEPSIAAGLEALRAARCGRVVVVPMYPQYAKVCAGTCLKEARAQLDALAGRTGWRPQVLEVESFHEQPAYLDALADGVRACWEWHAGAKLLVSFHSTPLADIRAGDPYERQTKETAAALARRLGVPDEDCIVAYQSRFDNRKWLSPFTDATAEILGATGVADLCVVAPGFVADNIETSIELGRGLRELFVKEARRFGTTAPRFTLVPALGEAPGLIAALADAVEAVLPEDLQAPAALPDGAPAAAQAEACHAAGAGPGTLATGR